MRYGWGVNRGDVIARISWLGREKNQGKETLPHQLKAEAGIQLNRRSVARIDRDFEVRPGGVRDCVQRRRKQRSAHAPVAPLGDDAEVRQIPTFKPIELAEHEDAHGFAIDGGEPPMLRSSTSVYVQTRSLRFLSTRKMSKISSFAAE